jgi:hypothetical protein
MPKGSASRAKSLLKKVNKELSTIPNYEYAAIGDNKSGEPVKNIITALRRGVRALQGKDSKSSLVAKRKKLESLIKEAEEYKGAKVLEGGSIAFGFGKDD